MRVHTIKVVFPAPLAPITAIMVPGRTIPDTIIGIGYCVIIFCTLNLYSQL